MSPPARRSWRGGAIAVPLALRHDWSDPAARAYVLSDRPLAEIAAALAISVGHARNLRGRFRRAEAPTER